MSIGKYFVFTLVLIHTATARAGEPSSPPAFIETGTFRSVAGELYLSGLPDTNAPIARWANHRTTGEWRKLEKKEKAKPNEIVSTWLGEDPASWRHIAGVYGGEAYKPAPVEAGPYTFMETGTFKSVDGKVYVSGVTDAPSQRWANDRITGGWRALAKGDAPKATELVTDWIGDSPETWKHVAGVYVAPAEEFFVSEANGKLVPVAPGTVGAVKYLRVKGELVRAK